MVESIDRFSSHSIDTRILFMMVEKSLYALSRFIGSMRGSVPLGAKKIRQTQSEDNGPDFCYKKPLND